MARALLAVLILTCSALLAAAKADDAKTNVVVSITTGPNGVAAHFALAHPVARFPFEYASSTLQDSSWHLQTTGLRYTVADVVADDGHPFDVFDVSVDALNVPTEATYPCVFRVGQRGYGLYAAYFAGKYDQFETTLMLKPAADQVILGFPEASDSWRVDQIPGQQAGHRYVFIGDRSYVQRQRLATYVAPPEGPAWLVHRIQDRINASIGFYTARTGRALASPPLVLLAMGGPDRKYRATQGDVTRGPAVALRLFGPGWDNVLGADELSELDHVLTHEPAHFWNSATSSSRHAEEEAWLHEGGADYWSFVARIKLLNMTDADRLAHISDVMNTCIGNLGGAKMKNARSLATYSCGEALEWFADVAARSATSGREDIFSLWKRILARADENGGLYDGDTFKSVAIAANPKLRDVFAMVSDQDGIERWKSLPAFLGAFGITLEPTPPTNESLRSTAVMHLERQICSHGPYGFWTGDKSLKLDTGDRCGLLSGDPDVDSIDGHNLFMDTQGAYRAVEKACSSGGTVAFNRAADGAKLAVTCKKPLPLLPQTYRVISGG